VPARSPSETAESARPNLSRLDPEHIKGGWRIFVECATRISTQPLTTGAGLLGEALQSLYKLFGTIRNGRPDPAARDCR
jgi:hypothetical protein